MIVKYVIYIKKERISGKGKKEKARKSGNGKKEKARESGKGKERERIRNCER